ncbi:MAG: Tol-Pal system subunit TolQ, partial [Holosporales bacterium]
MEPLQQAALSTATATLSPLDLFLMADWIVKSVMLTLLGMSIY